MKSQNFAGETDGDTIKNAVLEALSIHKVPVTQIKEAKNWFFIRREVSRIMSSKITGRAIPIMNRGFKPPREIIKLAFTQDTPPSLYHGKIRTSRQKFAVLTKALLRKEIDVYTFTDYAGALDIKEKQIDAVINCSLKAIFGG